MAGLPRSGSSVLSAILNQNPKFYSGPSSPVLSTMLVVENHFHSDELFMGYPKIKEGKKIISSIPYQYYSDIKKPIIFDKNRAWTSKIEYINGYLEQDPKIICPVRNIDEILTSLIMLIRRNPFKEGQPRINFIDEQLVKLNIPINDDNRCEFIASPDGILGQSLSSIYTAISNGYKNNLYFVEYEDLIQNPEKTIKEIYSFLGENYFEHTFSGLKNNHREKDLEIYGLEDMHKVRPEIISESKDPVSILSKKILTKCKGMEIWRSL
jgi:sulfotransferase